MASGKRFQQSSLDHDQQPLDLPFKKLTRISSLSVYACLLQEDSQTLLTAILCPPLHGTLSCSSSKGNISRPNVQQRSVMRLRIGRAGGCPFISCRGLGGGVGRGRITCQDMPPLTICSRHGFPSTWLTTSRGDGESHQIFAILYPLSLLSMGKGQLPPGDSCHSTNKGMGGEVFKEMITALLQNYQAVMTESQQRFMFMAFLR